MGANKCLGLDACQVESTLNLMGFKRRERRRIFDDLLVMEEAALPILNTR